MCGRKVNEQCRAVDQEEFRKRSIYDQCSSCEGYFQSGYHWADQIQNELLQPSAEPKRIHHELEAIAELIERHRAEFESLLAATTAEAVLQAKPPGIVVGYRFGQEGER